MALKPNRSQVLGLDLDRHLAIDAGAGTGKTTVMSMRYVEHLLEARQRATVLLPKGPRVPLRGRGAIRAPAIELSDMEEWHALLPSEVVAITFTNKAADELRQRIRDRLSNLRSAPDPNAPDATVDVRLRKAGDIEQLKSLLEDAPIGTIDSFLSGLVSPHLATVSDDPSSELVSDAQRPVLLARAINTAWRLQNEGHASLAGIGMDPAAFMSARNRLAWLLGGRGAAERMLMALLKQPLFVEEAERQLRTASGGPSHEISLQAICDLLLGIAGDLSEFAEQLQVALKDWLEALRAQSVKLGMDESLGDDNRITHLNTMAAEDLPEGGWEKLQWIHHVSWASMSKTQYDKAVPKALPNALLPTGTGQGGWLSGLKPWGGVAEADRQSARDAAESAAQVFRALLATTTGRAARQFGQMAFLLHPTLTLVSLPDHGANLPTDLDNPLPRHMDDDHTRMPSQLQATVLGDLFTLQRGVLSILNHIKLSEGVYDHSDMQRYAEDLLLARCPDVCRNWYPTVMVNELDDLGDRPWLDEHILRALNLAPSGKDGELATQDLERRYDHLARLRRRYRAFIIDEYQDTNPQQFRLLSRLWGRRKLESGEPEAPEGPWDPTICLVGDVKQSIYRFRQAQVTVMERAIVAIKEANQREDDVETRLAGYRRTDKMRDPRPVAGGGGESATFVAATELRGGVKGSDDEWIRIDIGDDEHTVLSDEIKRERALGHIDLTTNFRTAPNVLATLNNWFIDVFAPCHDLLPGTWHARSQPLNPPILKDGEEPRVGQIEWLATVPFGEGDASTDLDQYLDPFTIGERAKPHERENEMIAARLHALVNGLSLRLRGVGEGSDAVWRELPGVPAVKPEDILILLPRRKHVTDLLRRLQAWGVPAQADRQGALFMRPVVRELNHLLQILARPHDRHHAAAFARGSLVGMSDSQLELLFNGKGVKPNANQLMRLVQIAPTKPQRRLLARLQQLANRGQIITALTTALESGDILLVHPGLDSLQDGEQFIQLVEELRQQAGGDVELLADAVSILADQKEGALESKAIPPTGAVRVMTIHSAKGLEAKVVVLAGLFHEGHYSSAIEKQSSVVVTPELLAVNARPWRHVPAPLSGTWELAKALLDAQTAAERRRLFYVALTRVENHLIMVGAPAASSCSADGTLHLKRPVSRLPSMGEMWLDALRYSAHEDDDEESPWRMANDQVGEDLAIATDSWKLALNATELYDDPHLGKAPLKHLTIIHDPRSFTSLESRLSVRKAMAEHLKNAAGAKGNSVGLEKRPTPRSLKLSLAPHRLDLSFACNRRLWLGDVRGWSSEPMVLGQPEVNGGKDAAGATATAATSSGVGKAGAGADVAGAADAAGSIAGVAGLPDAATLGSLFHRLVEVGIGNPAEGGKLSGLEDQWSQAQASRLLEPAVIEQVLNELLPASADRAVTGQRLAVLAQIQEDGRLGKLCSGEEFDGQKVVGLRTELPFHLTVAVGADGRSITRWSVGGEVELAEIGEIQVTFDGRIDLALAVDGDGGPTLQVVDLKTEGCGQPFDETDPANGHELQHPVTDPFSTAAQSDHEQDLLDKHRLQLALYTMVLERSQFRLPQKERRKVLPPAIQASASGRMVVMSEAELTQAKLDFGELLEQMVDMKLNPHDEPERLPKEQGEICRTCPYYYSGIRLCGPQGEPLGIVSRS